MSVRETYIKLRAALVFAISGITAVSALSGGVAHATNNATMSAVQLRPMVVGAKYTIQVRVNTMGAHVNAVEADFTYNTSVLTFSSIDDASQSAFEINAQATGGSGSVAIGRGTLVGGGVTGDLKVANVTFDVTHAGNPIIAFQGSSELDDATLSSNILGPKNNGSFTTAAGIAPGHQLNSGQFVKSSNGCLAIMRPTGNFEVYNTSNSLIWSSMTSGHTGAYAKMRTDGNLVVFSSTNAVLWMSNTATYNDTEAVMQTDCNFVLYNTNGRALWSSMGGPLFHMLKAGKSISASDFIRSTDGKYSAKMLTNGNFAVYNSSNTLLWSTLTSSNAGAYASMQTDGNFVVYTQARHALYNTGTFGHSGVYAKMQTDGNFVIYDSSNVALWSWKSGRLY